MLTPQPPVATEPAAVAGIFTAHSGYFLCPVFALLHGWQEYSVSVHHECVYTQVSTGVQMAKPGHRTQATPVSSDAAQEAAPSQPVLTALAPSLGTTFPGTSSGWTATQ